MLFKPCVGVFVVFSALLLTFSACGDDSSSSANALPDEVADKTELKTFECNMSVIGEKVFVNDLDKYYECDGDDWFESYDQSKPHNKGNSSSSSRSSSSGKNLSSSKNSSSSSGGVFGSICRDKRGCDAMEESEVSSWHFYLKGESGGYDEYYYSANGKDLFVTIRKANGERDYKTYSMYDMESEDGVKKAFNFVKSTCENGNGNDTIVNVCKSTLIEQDSIIDERDGLVYKIVKIGDQWWMAVNLNYRDERYKSFMMSSSYGMLYSWSAAVDSIRLYAEKKDSINCGLKCVIDVSGMIQGLCPDGWHLPDTTEWVTLFQSIGATRARVNVGTATNPDFRDNYWNGAGKLKSKIGWNNSRNGTDDYEFSVFPAGQLLEAKGYVYSVGNLAQLITSVPYYYYEFAYNNNYYNLIALRPGDYGNKNSAYPDMFSVRCVKNDGKSGKLGWILPKCNSSNQGLVAPKETMRYLCDNGVWRNASLMEMDTFGESCSKSDSGRVIKGRLSDSTKYYCTTKGWVDYVQWNWDVPKEARFNSDVKYGSLVDERDGKVYKTVDIAGQTWMAENLNYSDSTKTPSLLERSWCNGNNNANCDVGGRLYSWNAAIDYKVLTNDENNPLNCVGDSACSLVILRGICPEGWHLPNYKELSNLEKMETAIKSRTGWNKSWQSENQQYVDGNGSNESGFSAVPTGWRKRVVDGTRSSTTWYFGSEFILWSSSIKKVDKSIGVYYFEVGSTSNKLSLITDYIDNQAFSVRCVKD